MGKKNNLIKSMKMKIFGGFLVVFLMLSNLFGVFPALTENVQALPTEQDTTTEVETKTDDNTGENKTSSASCEDSLGSLGWLVCPSTGKISEAVDFLYDKIEDVLEVNPVEAKDGSPVYEIWKYFQGVTNILFIVFLLVVVLSQVTGVGITNYGIKKTLPKLIVAAVLVNLSFYICSIAVDISNIFGEGLRGIFESIEASTMSGMDISGATGKTQGVMMAEMYQALAGGTALAVGASMVAFETGAIWMLIPLALGALVSVVIGLITIAMRQAVVTLLIMIAPLAMVAYILPNTEQWFKKWKQLLYQMLIFYPAFSLLFGASSVAGWAIIVSSQNGFGTLMGVAVQIFPLFFSWSLMKMSGTFLSTINSKLNGLASGAIGGVRGWAGSHRDLTRAKNLARKDAYTPSLRLQQFLSNRRVAREEETKEHLETAKNRGLAYAAMRNYERGTSVPSKEGEESYEAQARNARYQDIILRHKNNMNKGLGQLDDVKNSATDAQKARLALLDEENVEAFDTLKMEQARGETIDYRNAVGFHKRMEDAMNAHMDNEHGWATDKDGKQVVNPKYKRHFELGSVREAQANARYNTLSKVMEGNVLDAQYATATAAHAYDTQAKILKTKMQTYMDLTPPTRDVVYRLDEWTKNGDAASNMDAIISSLRVINQRGDTDIVKQQIDNILDKNIGGGLQLGTHGSQALASFLMFDVKDSDPWLRRFGKYINLETAALYGGKRYAENFDYDEYVKGYHYELDKVTGNLETVFAKKGMKELMDGTSLDNVERTAFSSFDDSIKKVYSHVGDDGKTHLDMQKYLDKREEIQKSVGPAFISASLKYLSGSEQLVNAVGFLTGYTKKQKKVTYTDNAGNEREKVVVDDKGNPVYEWVARWDAGGDLASDPEKARKYFEGKTLQYIGDQTPTQILGLRSDYKEPLLGHLAKAYEEETKMEDWDEEAIIEHTEYMKELADIQTRYADLPSDQAKLKRDKDIKELKNKMAGAQFRQLLDSKGKLEQIYTTRRSGAANNAKDWVREWLNLDNGAAINNFLDKRGIKNAKTQRKGKVNKEGDDAWIDKNKPRGYYNKVFREGFWAEIDKIYRDVDGESDMEEKYYNITHDFVEKTLGDGNIVVRNYEEYKRNNSQASRNELEFELRNLLYQFFAENSAE
ncbi:hypothetical protein IKF23_01305 [Candidatus Saccharibacteria bacterium]|nr:hypothetical protein [Candidatus Saccharibacteria bacterium]